MWEIFEMDICRCDKKLTDFQSDGSITGDYEGWAMKAVWVGVDMV